MRRVGVASCNKTTGEIREVTDPSRALISGKWSHIGRFKGPMLRDLAVRAPYFHDGSAATLDEAVAFYVSRFGRQHTVREIRVHGLKGRLAVTRREAGGG